MINYYIATNIKWLNRRDKSREISVQIPHTLLIMRTFFMAENKTEILKKPNFEKKLSNYRQVG